MKNIPTRFKPKPYAWHAAAISALLGAQVASDNEVFSRTFQVGPTRPFEHFGNVPTSALLVMAGTYPSLAIAEKLGLEPYRQNPTSEKINRPKGLTKLACTAVGAAIGAVANGLVETRWGLSHVQQVTDLYTNSLGVKGGTSGDFWYGLIAATATGRICASTFPSVRTTTQQVSR